MPNAIYALPDPTNEPVLGFLPGMGIAYLVFSRGADATRLPLEMSVESALSVFALILFFSFKNKGVATIEELREACIDMDVRLIGCQMTMDVFGFEREDFLDGCNFGGAATFLEFASDADVSLFV